MSQALTNSTPIRNWPYLALVRKELRGAAGIIVFAAVSQGVFVVGKTNLRNANGLKWLGNLSSSAIQPFLQGEFYSGFVWLSVLFAAALGFWQTLGESLGHAGTWPFLLHRPVSRRGLILLKLAVGSALVWSLSAAMIVGYATWAYRTESPVPFEWSMTHRAWHLWLWPPLIYFGAFLSGLRPARWWGTRLFPLVTSGLLLFFAVVVPYWLWWPFEASLAAFCDAWFVVAIVSVMSERDFG